MNAILSPISYVVQLALARLHAAYSTFVGTWRRLITDRIRIIGSVDYFIVTIQRVIQTCSLHFSNGS